MNSPACSQSSDKTKPQLFTQAELSDLIRELDLSKKKSELLASRLQEKNLLTTETKVTYYRNRSDEFLKFYTWENNNELCVITDIDGLMEKLDIEYEPSEWRLFIDASKASLKAVLLHNGNRKPSIPVAHSVNMRESYENMRILLKAIKYDAYKWKICGDLKIIAILLGMQLGYTKFMCFLCLWDSRANASHYKRKEWPRRNWTIGKENVLYPQLVDPKDILLPPLHIKLGLMKNFVKALDRDGQAFEYLRRIFPRMSHSKIKEGVFDGPQIRKVMKDKNFESHLTECELAAWHSFIKVVDGFLGNHKADNYEELVNNLLTSFKNMGCHMSLKIHFLFSHLDYFPPNLGAVSEEMGERFHQDLKVLEKRYQGRWDPAMMADFCWLIKREDPNPKKRQKSYR